MLPASRHPVNGIERASVPFERSVPPGQALPALDHRVYILGIEFQTVTDATGRFRRRQRSTAAEERLVYQFAGLGVIEDWLPHQLDRLLRRMIEFLLT